MTRTETDSLGDVTVPEDAYYGGFTQRAKTNFQLTGKTPPRAFVKAFGEIKVAAAEANKDLGLLGADIADAIVEAAEAVAAGDFDESFVIDMIQAGAGTPIHMNANEVVANRATELLGGEKGDYLVHPNDDVNMGQSSNNVVPTAVRLATIELSESLAAALNELAQTFKAQGDTYDEVVKVGRTHLQDAVPITFGQEFRAYATHIENGVSRIQQAADELHTVGVGGNAIGTGINTPEAFRETIVAHLSDVTGYDLEPADDGVAITQSMAPFTAYAGAVDALLSDLLNLADDLMLLSSGPNAGLHEVELPEVEPGSSIMPGKVNPSIVEAFKMSCLQAQGHSTVLRDASREGDLDMHVMTPLIAYNLFELLTLLTSAVKMLNEKCVSGIDVDEDRVQDLFDASTVTATALAPYLGYDTVAAIVKQAEKEEKRVRDVVIEEGLMEEADVEHVLQSDKLTGPNGVDQELVEKYRN